MATERDPYQILGLTKEATQEEIRSAYRKLARKLHPDLNPGKKESEAAFKELQTAYDRIDTPEKRAELEKERQEARFGAQTGGHGFHRGPFYWETQSNPDEQPRYSSSHWQDIDPEILNSLFGGSGGHRAGRRQARAGEDHLLRLPITFREMALGSEREVRLANGQTMKIQIPPGVHTGSKLRFAEKGGQASGPAPHGDLYIEIEVEKSSRFARKGLDLEMETPLELDDAVLGGEIEVMTLESPVKLRIPPGTSSGTRFRLKSKGIVDSRSGKRGDLYVVARLRMPMDVDDELRDAIRAWRDRTGRPQSRRSAA